MLVFIDESGDPGLNIEGGSSKYFIVALVAFDDHDEALAADDRISRLRNEQGFPAKFEFHFNKMKPSYRRRFLEAIASYNFFYCAVVIDKSKLTEREFQFKESIHKYACGLLLEDIKPRLNNAIVVVDGSESKSFRRELKSYLVRKLKDHSGKSLIKNVRIHDSTTNNLLQLADMVVGSVARSYSGKKDSREYRSLIIHREMNVEVWPK
jgi:disulfide oxidoreductase YuzD